MDESLILKILEKIKNKELINEETTNINRNELGKVAEFIKDRNFATNILVRKTEDVYTIIDFSESELTVMGQKFNVT